MTLLAVLVRLDHSFASGWYLWAEDGPAFYNQARTGGLETVAQPYAGYLHVFPRLVAWLASGLPLTSQPVVFCVAWLLALTAMIHTIASRGRAMGLDSLSIVGLALLIVFQPTSDEMFFNLTNAQWLLGVALCLLMLTGPDSDSRGRLPFLALLCLTGPFCLVILPLVVLAHVARRPTRRELVVLGIFAACASVQLFFLSTTDRITGMGRHVDLPRIVDALIKLLLFFPNRLREWVPALGFWSIFGWLLARSVARRKPQRRAAFLLLAAAVAFLGSSLVTGALALDDLRYGPSRYTWIPYSLVFFSAAIVSASSTVGRIAMAVCLAVVCWSKFTPIWRYDFHYPSFVKLASAMPVAIPLNPVGANAWEIETGPLTEPKEVASRSSDGANAFADLSGHTIVCEHATDVAVLLEGDHLADGIVGLSWSASGDAGRAATMERLYHRGPVHMQFAFPYPAGGVLLASSQLSDPAVVRLRHAAVVCLP